jgi:hypothetical protein
MSNACYSVVLAELHVLFRSLADSLDFEHETGHLSRCSELNALEL